MSSFWLNKPKISVCNDEKNAFVNGLSDRVSCVIAGAKIEEADILNSQNELEKAYRIYKDILAENPMHTDALFGIGVILEKQLKFDLAIQFLSKAIETNPHKIEALLARGRIFRQQGMSKNAISDFTKIISNHPDFFEALIARGIALGHTSQFDAAIDDFNSAIRVNPSCAEAFYNRGVVFEKLHQFVSAIADYSIAIKLNPHDYRAYNNRGVAQRETGCFDAANKDFEESIKINPDFAEGHYNKSLILLSVGKLKEGFKLYEHRWKTAHFQSQLRNFPQPLWLGNEDLTGKTILLHSEQGLGDSIQFSRYIKFFSEMKDCKVLLEIETPLIELMECLLPKQQIIRKGASLPYFNYHCPLMSLPLAFSGNGKNIPFSEGYLFADAEQVKFWESRHKQTSKLKVGICWRGNSKNINDYKRSIKLASVIDLLDESFAWTSLQHDADNNEQELIDKNPNITHFGSEVGNFAKTAALCESLDAIISVDTSMAHLAGAMGKKTCLLLSDVADARWRVKGSITPWYLNTKLIRQQNRLKWRPSIQLAKKLVKLRSGIQAQRKW